MSARASVAVLGGSGLVGACLVEQWSARADVIAPAHAELDVLDATALVDFVQDNPARTVVNLVAWADVDGAEPETGNTHGTVYRLNVDFPGRLAEACSRRGKHLIHVSTDYVFDGTNALAPYTERDATGALCWYAETKLRGEHAVMQADPGACVARIEMPFTGRKHPKRDLARTIVARLQHGQTIQGVTDQRITPVFLDHAAEALWRLVEARYTGVIHVASSDATTPFGLAQSLAQRMRLSEALILPETFERFSTTRPARRPQHSWLDVSHFNALFGAGILQSVEAELDAWVKQWHTA